jgi:hypothetical protein
MCYSGKNMGERILIVGKYLRPLIAIVVILSLVLIGKSEAALAEDRGGDESSSGSVAHSISAGKDKHCKDKDRKHDRCHDDDDDDDGTVKPPPDEKDFCRIGIDSVGGLVVVVVARLPRRSCVNAATDPNDPVLDQLPPGMGTVVPNVLTLTLPPGRTTVGICFAVPPGKKNPKIYSNSTGAWAPIKTLVKKGVACAEVSNSGKYILVTK